MKASRKICLGHFHETFYVCFCFQWGVEELSAHGGVCGQRVDALLSVTWRRVWITMHANRESHGDVRARLATTECKCTQDICTIDVVVFVVVDVSMRCSDIVVEASR